MNLFGAILVVAACLAVVVYRYDSRRKQPPWALMLAFTLGYGAMWFIGQADDAAINFAHAHGTVVVKAAVVATIEEGGKLSTILLLAVLVLRRQFRSALDGLLIGQLVGLGMALEESRLYLSLEPATMQTLGVEIVRLFAHSLMAGIIGFGVGGSLSDGRRKYAGPGLLVLCAGLTTTVHFGWNLIAYSRSAGLLDHLVPMMLMLTLMLLWKWFCTIAQARVALPITTALHRKA